MSRLLDEAATLDAARAADLAANDAALGIVHQLRAFQVEVKCGQSVRLCLGTVARSTVDATIEHLDLVRPGEYLFVRPAGEAA